MCIAPTPALGVGATYSVRPSDNLYVLDDVMCCLCSRLASVVQYAVPFHADRSLNILTVETRDFSYLMSAPTARVA